MKYRIADAIVDFDSNRIERADRSVELEPRVADVLRYLVEHSGRVVTREELLQQVWNTQNISDDAITRCVNLIRRSFDDSAREPRVLQTLTKRGYRLIADVVALDGAVPGPTINVVLMRAERHSLGITAGAFLGGGAAMFDKLEAFLAADMERIPSRADETAWKGAVFSASTRVAGGDMILRIRKPMRAPTLPYGGAMLGFVVMVLMFLGTGTHASAVLAAALIGALIGAALGWLLFDRIERRAADDVTHRRDAILAAILRQ